MCLFTQWTEPGMPIKIQCRRALLREREKGKFPQARGSSPPFFERLKFKEVVLSSIHECCGWREKRRRRRDLKKSSLANKLWIFNLEILIKLPRQSLFFTTTASIPAACSSFLSLSLFLFVLPQHSWMWKFVCLSVILYLHLVTYNMFYVSRKLDTFWVSNN